MQGELCRIISSSLQRAHSGRDYSRILRQRQATQHASTELFSSITKEQEEIQLFVEFLGF